MHPETNFTEIPSGLLGEVVQFSRGIGRFLDFSWAMSLRIPGKRIVEVVMGNLQGMLAISSEGSRTDRWCIPKQSSRTFLGDSLGNLCNGVRGSEGS